MKRIRTQARCALKAASLPAERKAIRSQRKTAGSDVRSSRKNILGRIKGRTVREKSREKAFKKKNRQLGRKKPRAAKRVGSSVSVVH